VESATALIVGLVRHGASVGRIDSNRGAVTVSPTHFYSKNSEQTIVNRNALYVAMMGLSLVLVGSLLAGPESSSASIPVVLQLGGGALAVVSGAILLHGACQQSVHVE